MENLFVSLLQINIFKYKESFTITPRVWNSKSNCSNLYVWMFTFSTSDFQVSTPPAKRKTQARCSDRALYQRAMCRHWRGSHDLKELKWYDMNSSDDWQFVFELVSPCCLIDGHLMSKGNPLLYPLHVNAKWSWWKLWRWPVWIAHMSPERLLTYFFIFATLRLYPVSFWFIENPLVQLRSLYLACFNAKFFSIYVL